MKIRPARSEDRGFLLEMARHASTRPGSPPPEINETVLALLPGRDDVAIVAEGEEGHLLGALWWNIRTEDPLMRSEHGHVLPEVAIATTEEARGKGVGIALMVGLEQTMIDNGIPSVCLNVHIINTPAINLYMRNGFVVAGAGRGIYGVAMRKTL